MVTAVQIWNPDDWEAFALNLLQSRHGVLNVHKIPAAHKGDWGIDYYCTSDAVAYQCYVPREPIDIVTRAERQKKKITTDTSKIVENATDVSNLFLNKPIKYWRLIVPLHDSKDVNLHCANKTQQMRGLNCPHLDKDFELGIDDLTSFSQGAVAGGMAGLATLKLSIPHPTQDELAQWQAGSADLLANATHKLLKRAGAKGVQDAVAEATKSFLHGKSVLDALRSNSPDLHERIIGAVANRSRRLSLAGPHGGPTPNLVLNAEIDHLTNAIKTAAPNLSDDVVEQIAMGAVSEWIMRCPLDFEANAI